MSVFKQKFELQMNIFVIKGTRLLFYIFPGKYRDLLFQLIQEYGGLISPTWNDNTLNIAGQYQDIPAEFTLEVLGYDYIVACLRAKLALYTVKYRLHKEYKPDPLSKHAFKGYYKYKHAQKSIASRDMEDASHKAAIKACHSKGAVKGHESTMVSMKTRKLVQGATEAREPIKHGIKACELPNPKWRHQLSGSIANSNGKLHGNKWIGGIQSNKTVQRKVQDKTHSSCSLSSEEKLTTHASNSTFSKSSQPLCEIPVRKQNYVTIHQQLSVSSTPKDDTDKKKIENRQLNASLTFKERSLLYKHAQLSCGLLNPQTPDSSTKSLDVAEETMKEVTPFRRNRRLRDSSPVSDSDEEFLRKSRQEVATQKDLKIPPRMAYTNKDREAILHFISDENLFEKVKGRRIWQDLEDRNILPGRTWQSLMEHFRKQILPNLYKYRYVLSETEMKKLEMFKECRSAKTRGESSDSDIAESVLEELSANVELP